MALGSKHRYRLISEEVQAASCVIGRRHEIWIQHSPCHVRVSAKEILVQLETEVGRDKNSNFTGDNKVLFMSLVPKLFLELVIGVVPIILY